MEGFQRQSHGRMLTLSNVQGSQGRTVEALQRAVGESKSAVGGMAETQQNVTGLLRSAEASSSQLQELQQGLVALQKEVGVRPPELPKIVLRPHFLLWQ
jgi:hypothetical protein